jgi:hypothetical protein
MLPRNISSKNDLDPSCIAGLVSIFKADEIVTGTAVRASSMKAGFKECRRDNAFYLLDNDGKTRDSPEFSVISDQARSA